ncbi:MAG: L,D-transpeptidase family protein [Candidatus Sumerlaeaceae bacterium]
MSFDRSRLFYLLCFVIAGSTVVAIAKDLPASASSTVLTAEVRKSARERLRPYFERQHVEFPPKNLRIVATKQERRLKLFAPDHTGEWRFILQYPIAAASGTSGPKLCEGDEQVPEGIYRVNSLNPHSKFHLSLELNYPNEFDRRQARADGRKLPLGRDIMIHGKWWSIGCIALGDTAAEDVYVLVSDTGLNNVRVVLAPMDLRELPPGKTPPLDVVTSQPAWVPALHDDLRRELTLLKDAGLSTTSLLVSYRDSIPPPQVTAAQAAAALVLELIQWLGATPKE